MSLIGPRPNVKAETNYYKQLLAFDLAATRPDCAGFGTKRFELRRTGPASMRNAFRIGVRRRFRDYVGDIPAVLRRVGAR